MFKLSRWLSPISEVGEAVLTSDSMLSGASYGSAGPFTMTLSCLYISELGYSIPHQYVPASVDLTSEMVIWAPLEFGIFVIMKRGSLFGARVLSVAATIKCQSCGPQGSLHRYFSYLA